MFFFSLLPEEEEEHPVGGGSFVLRKRRTASTSTPQVAKLPERLVLGEGSRAAEEFERLHADGKDDRVGFQREVYFFCCSGGGELAVHSRDALRHVVHLEPHRLGALPKLYRAVIATVRTTAILATAATTTTTTTTTTTAATATRHRLGHFAAPGLEDTLADVAAAPAHVEGQLVLEHKKIRHAQRRCRGALLPGREEPRQDHGLEGLVVHAAGDAELDAKVAEGQLVETVPCLVAVVELREGEDQGRCGELVQGGEVEEVRVERLTQARGQLGLVAVDGPDGLEPLRRPLALLRVARERVALPLFLLRGVSAVEQLEDVVVVVPEAVDPRLGSPPPA